jgi:hypothetical protein
MTSTRRIYRLINSGSKCRDRADRSNHRGANFRADNDSSNSTDQENSTRNIANYMLRGHMVPFNFQ